MRNNVDRGIGSVQADVDQFMRAVGQALPEKPTNPDVSVVDLRIKLITEEFDELISDLLALVGPAGNERPAIQELNLIASVSKEIADLIYVAVGTASALGVDLEDVWELVHQSNCEKIAGPVRADGKRMKPANYEPPNITAVIREQVASWDFENRSIK